MFYKTVPIKPCQRRKKQRNKAVIFFFLERIENAAINLYLNFIFYGFKGNYGRTTTDLSQIFHKTSSIFLAM